MWTRALPARMIDLVRDGVPAHDLKTRAGRAVFSALVGTAASAQFRGWDRSEWEALVQKARRRHGALSLPEPHCCLTARTSRGLRLEPLGTGRVLLRCTDSLERGFLYAS